MIVNVSDGGSVLIMTQSLFCLDDIFNEEL